MSIRAHLIKITNEEQLLNITDLFKSINWAYKAQIIFKTAFLIENKGEKWLEFLVWNKHEEITDIVRNNLPKDLIYFDDNQSNCPNWWYEGMYGKQPLRASILLGSKLYT